LKLAVLTDAGFGMCTEMCPFLDFSTEGLALMCKVICLKKKKKKKLLSLGWN